MPIGVGVANAQGAVGGRADLQGYGLNHFRHQGRFQQLPLNEPDIPQGQVVRRHGQFSGPEKPPWNLWLHRPYGAVAKPGITLGIGIRYVLVHEVYGTLHAKRFEDAFPQEGHQGFAAYLLHNFAGGDKVGVAVLPLGTRFEIQRRAQRSRMPSGVTS